MKDKIEKLRRVHRVARAGLIKTLDGITEEQLYWQPAAESRSIGDMMRHLIRVDMWFYKRHNITPDVADIKRPTVTQLQTMLQQALGQYEAILDGLESDALLDRRTTAADKVPYKSLGAVMAHIPQHYLYHMSQMIYLRRAQDRTWESPLPEWETATDVIAQYMVGMAGEHE